MTIVKIPSGIVPDNTAVWGLLGLMANVNNYSETQTTQATAGTNTTLTAAQALSGGLFLTAGASGGFTITLPSTVALFSALGPTIPTDGTYSEPMWITNSGVGQTGTLTAGDSNTTLSGTMTIATNTTRKFLLTVTGPTTITIINQGSLSL
jgi:hypothetical protein